MHARKILLVATLLLCVAAAETPAPEDSATDKGITGRTAPTDFEGKGEASDGQEFRPLNRGLSGRTDTRRRQDANMDEGKGSDEVAGETAAEGLEPK
jgi:hypothetical protein